MSGEHCNAPGYRPSVTDDAHAAEVATAWAEYLVSHEPHPSDMTVSCKAFFEGWTMAAEWAAGRAETPVIHLSNPDDGASFCDQPVTIITEAGDTRPVCQTCHRGAMKHAHARAETTTEHEHIWQWRQNVTSRGDALPPIEVCQTEGCDAARSAETTTATTEDVPLLEDEDGAPYPADVQQAHRTAVAHLLATARTRPTDTTKEN